NAGISATLQPTVEDNRLRLSLAGDPGLEISNDIVRALAEALNLKVVLANALGDEIERALSDPAAALQLPEELAGYELLFDTARIAVVNGRLSLVLDGRIPRRQPQLPAFLDFLGSVSGQEVDAAQCQ